MEKGEREMCTPESMRRRFDYLQSEVEYNRIIRCKEEGINGILTKDKDERG